MAGDQQPCTNRDDRQHTDEEHLLAGMIYQ